MFIDQIFKNMMIDIIKGAHYITFYKSGYPFPTSYFLEGSMTSSFGSETVG